MMRIPTYRANGSDREECEACEGRCPHLALTFGGKQHGGRLNNFRVDLVSSLSTNRLAIFWCVPPVIYPDDALQRTRANGVD